MTLSLLFQGPSRDPADIRVNTAASDQRSILRRQRPNLYHTNVSFGGSVSIASFDNCWNRSIYDKQHELNPRRKGRFGKREKPERFPNTLFHWLLWAFSFSGWTGTDSIPAPPWRQMPAPSALSQLQPHCPQARPRRRRFLLGIVPK